MRVLYFTIAGVLQSWGEQSSWNVRDSAEWPTKSGITGMISAALGWGYDDPRIGELCESIEIGFKTCNRFSPQLNDFQTVNYYGGILADGKRETRDAQKTIVQHKYYIMDRKYLVAISASDEILNSIFEAMMNPRWAMHLGRACCPPSQPIIPVIKEYDSIEEALTSIPLYEGCDEVIQIEQKTGQRRTDVREATRGKRYRERYVAVKAVNNNARHSL